MFYSTRNHSIKKHASECIIQGISKEGGLFLPETIATLKVDESFLNLTYPQLAFKVLRLYLDDFTDEEIRYCVESAYSKQNFADKIVGFHHEDKFSFLELFHGRTITFKDMALSLLPYLMEVSKKKNHITKKIMILTATSGDTGSAALSSFSEKDGIDINVLYPDDGISKVQEKQMLYFTSASSRAYALKNSNFDTCQTLVKELLNTPQKDYLLSSANSINIGRLLPQIVYYYASYLEMVKANKVKLGEKISVIVPTGNFGNIFASYLAKCMGLPLDKIICASNENRVLTDFFETGTYSTKREFVKTNSPSMDILISSNLERLISLLSESEEELVSYMTNLKTKQEFTVSDKLKAKLNDFMAISLNQEETIDAIKDCFDKYDYLIDPHTAVSYGGYLRLANKLNNHLVIVSTASPFKFSETILKAFGKEENDYVKALELVVKITHKPMPEQIKRAIYNDIPQFKLNREEVADRFFKNKVYEVITPGTSANLGCAFDVAGIALNIYNVFTFTKTNQDELVNFPEEYSDVKNNLVLAHYQKAFALAHKKYQPVRITLKKQDVPNSRGLGSSSTCILGGLVGANMMMNNFFTKAEILNIAVKEEGHPDNVAPCLNGGVVASFKTEDKYHLEHYDVNQDLKFILVIPEYKIKTVDARKVLPKTMDYQDVVYNISHVIHLPKALKEGDLSLLKEVIVDKIHTPYRLGLIPCGDKVKEIANQFNLPFTISGSGSAMLIIAKDEKVVEVLKNTDLGLDVKVKVLNVDANGVEEVTHYE